MSSTRIMELASIIHNHTSKVDDYLGSQNLPTPSFDISYPATFSLPPEIQVSRQAVLEASDELTTLMLGPASSIAGQPLNSWTSIQAIQRFGIAKSFPPGTTSTFSAIALACSISESDVRRLLRYAMTCYIFHETSPGIVEHTAASKTLAEIPPFGQLVGFLSGEMWPSASRLVDAMEKWPGSEEPNEAGFALAYRTDLPMFNISDKYATKILRALIPGLKNGARVVVSELCLPKPCTLSPYAERSARSFDLSMKGIQNAKERDADDWEQLFEFADSRFKFQGITKPNGSTLSIVNASWDEKSTA
ncbi:O-methyltransferase aurJ [Lachnellula suecica]|uniref:O-methyltransferase aurJ n=1 Tax=Lachnellula suecica TaxID=602035 RepID=A0A8T9CC82_9HELO|nr:O-methyltransferase aurJ [Lachnellula suecica]